MTLWDNLFPVYWSERHQFWSYRIDAIHLNLAEIHETLLRIFQFFAARPGNHQLGLKDFVESLTRLGEPAQVTDSLNQHFFPIFNTFPRFTNQSFWFLDTVLQDDPSVSCEICRQELGRSHGLERVWRLWRLWAGLQEMASDVEDSTRRHARCHEHVRWRRGEVLSISIHGKKRCLAFPTLSDQDVFRYFSKREVIVRLIQNFVFHEDLQFPGWTLED